MRQVVKWGIIGLGNIAYEFAKAFNSSDNAQLIALASKSKEKLDEFGKNLYSLKIDYVSQDIIEGKTQSSFPGIKKKIFY